MDLFISSHSISIRVVIIYRPPKDQNKRSTAPLFFKEFLSLLETLALCKRKLLISGDLNFHVDDPADKDACNFLDILDSANPEQYWPNTRWWAYTWRYDILVDNFSIWDDIYTSVVHYGVKCYIDMARPKAAKKIVNVVTSER